MPKRRVTPQRAFPEKHAAFDDDSGAEAPLAMEAPPGRCDARLVVEKGDYAGKVLKLDGGTAMLGRSSKCEMALKGSAGVSRRHCKLQVIAGRYAVIDLSSRNGTVVNGETVARKFLNDGDLLEIGDERMRFIMKTKAARVDDDRTRDRPAPRTGSALLAPAERTASGLAAPLDDDWAPRGYVDEQVAPPIDERSGPYTLKPQRRGFGATRALSICALLLVAALAGVAWDLAVGGRRSLLFARTHAPALAGPLARVEAALADVVHPATRAGRALAEPRAPESQNDAGSPLPTALPQNEGAVSGELAAPALARREESPNDATDSPPAPADAGDATTDNTPPAEGDSAGGLEPARVVVTASAGGRVGSLRVRPGSALKKGQTLVMLEAPGALRRKLTSLRDEERAFEQAVEKGNQAARRDLNAVRADIVELLPRVRGTALVSDVDGTVVDVLVRDGQVIKGGAPLVSVAP